TAAARELRHRADRGHVPPAEGGGGPGGHAGAADRGGRPVEGPPAGGAAGAARGGRLTAFGRARRVNYEQRRSGFVFDGTSPPAGPGTRIPGMSPWCRRLQQERNVRWHEGARPPTRPSNGARPNTSPRVTSTGGSRPTRPSAAPGPQ